MDNEAYTQRSREAEIERLSPLKILFVSETPLDNNYPNGVLTTVRKTLDYFQTQGHEVTVVCPRTETVEDIYAGYPIHTVRSAIIQGFPIGIGGSNKIPKLFKKVKPDILLSFSPFGFMSEYAIAAAKSQKIPIIENYQTDVVGYFDTSEKNMIERYQAILKPDGKTEYSPAMKALRKLAAKTLYAVKLGHKAKKIAKKRVAILHNHATINLAPSRSAKDEIISHGVKEDSIRIWGRGVDMDTYHPDLRASDAVQSLRRLILQGRERPIVGYIGRIAPEKDVDDLVALSHIDMQLIVVGDGPSLDDTKQTLGSDVIFFGKKHNPELSQLYSVLDVFVHTGKKETFGQTIQEAQATGIPVVAPAIGGPLDTIIDGETGFLYSPYDKQSMSSLVEKLVCDPELRKKIGAQARKSVELKSWDRLGEQLNGYIQELLV